MKRAWSWRDYGRLGFFFSKLLAKGATLELNYRFVVRELPAPGDRSGDAQLRAECERDYQTYTREPKH